MMRSFRKACLAGALTMAACGAAVPAVAADNDAIVPDASRTGHFGHPQVEWY